MIKKNKKGFIYIETIITTVVLLTSLILLYSAFSTTLNIEKKRLYYDDIAYIYKTQVIANTVRNTLRSDGLLNDDTKYLNFFNYGSNIFVDNGERLRQLYNVYNYESLIYLQISDITSLKQCLKNLNYSNSKCKNALNSLDAFSTENLKDYLLALDVDSTAGSNGILISIIMEPKNGYKYDETFTSLSYDACFQNKLIEYGFLLEANKNNPTKVRTAQENYYKSNISFNMYCETAYYYSWVYL